MITAGMNPKYFVLNDFLFIFHHFCIISFEELEKQIKLLGVRFDSKLTFDTHINDICKKQALN